MGGVRGGGTLVDAPTTSNIPQPHDALAEKRAAEDGDEMHVEGADGSGKTMTQLVHKVAKDRIKSFGQKKGRDTGAREQKDENRHLANARFPLRLTLNADLENPSTNDDGLPTPDLSNRVLLWGQFLIMSFALLFFILSVSFYVNAFFVEHRSHMHFVDCMEVARTWTDGRVRRELVQNCWRARM